jgi:putative ABC transport system permease protein
MEQIKGAVRRTWPRRAAGSALRDLRYAGRSLLKSPGFAAIVVATLALGIGVTLTMFSVMRAVLWRPLPYPEPDRIVTIQVDARNVRNAGATRGEVLALNERSRSLEQVSTIDVGDVNVEYAGGMEHVAAASVSEHLLPLLGVRPALGRLLDPRLDDGTQQALGALISDGLWHRRFGADPRVIGTAVRIDDVAIPIVGVLPQGFRLFLTPSLSDLEQIDLWLPWHLDATDPYRGIPVVARLRPGVTLDQANAELETLAAQFEREHPEFYAGATGWMASPADRDLRGARVRFTVRRLQDEMTREARPALFLLSGAVGFVLLIACVNVANLMLARGSARQRELEIRRALGATRVRIVVQLLTESLVLAVASAAIGLICAGTGLEAIRRFGASHIPLQSRIGMDAPVMLFALALSVVTSLLFGLLPAWRLASGTTDHPLRAGRSETAGSGTRRLQRTLVAAEVALSIVPLVCAGLMLRSFVNLMHQPLGFNPAGVVTARVPLDYNTYPQAEQRWSLMRDVLDRVRALPEVESASAAAPLPLAGQETRRVGRADRPDTPPTLATQQMALPGYLGAIGTPLLEGRDFTDADVATRHAVTIVDEGLAHQLWPEGAIGKTLSVYRTGRRDDLEVVGVTVPMRATRVRDDSIPHFIMPYNGSYARELTLVVRTPETAERLAPRIEISLDLAHAGRAAYDIRPMSAYVEDSVGDTRFIFVVLAAFASVSLVLAAVGLYGTLAYLTAQRTREFGIRLALGSSANAIVALVVREGVLLAAAGAAMGVMGVAAGTGALGGFLYEVRPLDGLTLAAVVGLVAVIALGAAGVPAWRATRIDAQSLLRSE